MTNLAKCFRFVVARDSCRVENSSLNIQKEVLRLGELEPIVVERPAIPVGMRDLSQLNRNVEIHSAAGADPLRGTRIMAL